MKNSVLAQLAALPSKTTPELKQLWRDLYDREPPPYNKPFLIKRLAYRIQELAYGGLSARAEAKLKELIEEEDRRVNGKLPVRKGDRPIAGTRLIREWKGVEHTATVLDDGFEYQGRRYKSLSAIARAITGTRWNGPAFFGLRNHRSANEDASPQSPLRHLHPRLDRRAPRHGVQLARRAARGGAAYIQSQKHEGWILVGDRYDDGGFSGGTMERPALQRLLRDVESGVIDVIVVYKVDRLSRSLTDFARIVEVFEKNKASFVSITQQFNTTTSMGRLTLNILLSVRPVRARGDRRAHPRQVRRLAAQGHVDGRHAAARLRRPRPQAGGERDGSRARPADLQPLPARRLGDEAGAGTAPRRPYDEIVDDAGRQARGRASRSTRARSTRSSTTGSTSARRCTRGRAIPASTRRSSIERPGTRCRRSSPRTRSLAPTARARRRRRCCAA